MNINNKDNNIHNKGIIAGATAATAMKYAARRSVSNLIGSFEKNYIKLSPSDTVEIKSAMNEALENSGLAKRGMKIFFLKEQPKLSIGEKFNTFINTFKNNKNQNIFKRIVNGFNSLYKFESQEQKLVESLTNAAQHTKRIKGITSVTKPLLGIDSEIAELSTKKVLLRVQKGKNAITNIGAKKIVLPEKSLHTAAFHEMGHYLNILKPQTRQIAKLKYHLKNVPAAVLILALLNSRILNDNNKNTKENKEKRNIIQKAHDGIKKHAGLIAGLSMVPRIADEAMASINGQKLAKNLVAQGKLSSNIYNKIKISNVLGLSSYIVAAIIVGAVTNTAIKLKDKIQANYEKKHCPKKV